MRGRGDPSQLGDHPPAGVPDFIDHQVGVLMGEQRGEIGDEPAWHDVTEHLRDGFGQFLLWNLVAPTALPGQGGTERRVQVQPDRNRLEPSLGDYRPELITGGNTTRWPAS